MSIDAWITLGTLVLVASFLVRSRIGPDLIMAGGLVLLMGGRVVDWDVAMAGFANQALLMIGGLFVVAAGLKETGGIELIGRRLLGRPASLGIAQIRMMVPVAGMSAFMNTTPIVAMYLPMVSDWAKRLRISPSKLFMPLSFSGILGGQGTMIGTGSNLILMTLFVAFMQDPPEWVTEMGVAPPSAALAFWGPAWLGVPVAVFGMAFIVIATKWLLPDRTPAGQQEVESRQYQVEMFVQKGASVAGKTIEEAGLRSLPGLYLHGIEREGRALVAVGPKEQLCVDDRLIFVGAVESVVDLRKIPGLVPQSEQLSKIQGPPLFRTLVEAVVSSQSPLVERTVRASRFRTKYNAVILAVHRGGKHITGKIGDIVLQRGDTLLLEADRDFIKANRHSSDFYLVSQVEDSRPPSHDKAVLSLAILGLLIFGLTTNLIGRVTIVWLCGLLMVATRCLSGPAARRAINLQVLIVIGSAMGIGAAVEESGLAAMISGGLIDAAGNLDLGPRGTLLMVFIATSIAAQLMTNFAAAVIMFPIAMGAAAGMDASPYPFLFTMMVAAGCNFLTPITYQTNLMVYGPGGYKFLDYTRLGLPLTALAAIIAVVLAPIVFPFVPVT